MENAFLFRKIRGAISKARRSAVAKSWREQNAVSDVSIICSNCVGGLLYHDLGLQFLSPTINLWIDAASFVTFCENLEGFLAMPLTDVKWSDERNYPVGTLDDSVHIYFQHYKSVEEAILKWEDRKKRVNFNNIAMIATDRDGMTDELEKRFLKLPFKKIIYVNSERKVLSEKCIYIPGFEMDEQLPDMTSWADFKGHRLFDKYFDIVRWINS